MFNPPYVPTPPDELLGDGISRSWAGGDRGREVLDRLLPHVGELLAPNGRLYLVLLSANDPDEVAAILKRQGLEAQVHSSTQRRQAGGGIEATGARHVAKADCWPAQRWSSASLPHLSSPSALARLVSSSVAAPLCAASCCCVDVRVARICRSCATHEKPKRSKQQLTLRPLPALSKHPANEPTGLLLLPIIVPHLLSTVTNSHCALSILLLCLASCARSSARPIRPSRSQVHKCALMCPCNLRPVVSARGVLHDEFALKKKKNQLAV